MRNVYSSGAVVTSEKLPGGNLTDALAEGHPRAPARQPLLRAGLDPASRFPRP